MNGGTAGEDNQGEADSDTDDKTKFDDVQKVRRRKHRQNVAKDLVLAEGDVTKEANSYVDPRAEVNSSPHNIIHVTSCRPLQTGVDLEHIGLAREGH